MRYSSVFAVIIGSASAFQTSGFAGRILQTRTSPKSAWTQRVSMSTATADKVATLRSCKADLMDMLDETNAAPILIRLAWHDAGTYDKSIGTSKWPKCGGANGSIRFDPEINHGANAGLTKALALLQPYKEKYPDISWADIMQMASAAAVEHTGGPTIDMKYGRVDAASAEDCSPEGNLPDANAPFPDAKTPQEHLRNVFYRQGFNDQGIVALSGAHTLGRAYADRSGTGAAGGTKFTTGDVVVRHDGKPGYGNPGGSSWTEKFLKFDNSYYQTVADPDADPELLKLDTDKSVFDEDGFRPYALKYKEDEAAFFSDYAKVHKQLSEQGAKFKPAEGITI